MMVTLEEVRTLADKLSPLDMARLAAHLNTQLAQTLVPTPAQTAPRQVTADAWSQLLAYSAETRTAYPHAPNVSDQLEADRGERDTGLAGESEG